MQLTVATSSLQTCALQGGTVAGSGSVIFMNIGNCTINANQLGDASVAPAAEVQQSFNVRSGKSSQHLQFDSQVPAVALVGGLAYAVSASSSSGLPVALTIDLASSSVCTFPGGVALHTGSVAFTGTGMCTVNANQAGRRDVCTRAAKTAILASWERSDNLSSRI